MSYETKERSFTVFANKHKKSDNHPDMRGIVKLGGVEYEIAMWSKRTRAGEPYYSGKIDEKPKVSREQVNKPASKPPADPRDPRGDFDDSIPF